MNVLSLLFPPLGLQLRNISPYKGIWGKSFYFSPSCDVNLSQFRCIDNVQWKLIFKIGDLASSAVTPEDDILQKTKQKWSVFCFSHWEFASTWLQFFNAYNSHVEITLLNFSIQIPRTSEIYVEKEQCFRHVLRNKVYCGFNVEFRMKNLTTLFQHEKALKKERI
jgi:hypothetical protein